MELAGPLRTPVGLAQWKRASSPGKAGTSGFLSVSDSDRRVPAELGQESQASSCLSNGTLLASRVVQWVSGPLETRDASLTPGLGRSPRGGHGNPLQYSCQENPMDSLAGYSRWGHKEPDVTEHAQ